MSKPRTLTDNKVNLLNAIRKQPGLNAARYSEITGISIDRVRKTLFEFLGQQLVRFDADDPKRIRRGRWYPLDSPDNPHKLKTADEQHMAGGD